MRYLSGVALSLAVLGLSLFSAIFVYSSTADASGPDILQAGLSPQMRKQMVFYCLGLFLFYALSRFPYRQWIAFALPLYVFNVLLLISLWQFGVVRGGARSWLDLGFTQFQPSETMKTSWMIYLAAWLRYRKDLTSFWGMMPAFLITGIPMVLVLIQPDMGTAILYIPTLFVVLFLSGVKKRHLSTIIGIMMLSCLPVWTFVLKDYQKARIYAILDPEAHAQTTAYQMNNSLLAIGEGFWFGKGIGEGRVNRLNLLPEAHTDFIFSIVAEEMGFVGASLLIFLYMTLFFASLWLGAITREPFGRTLAIGMGSMMMFQAVINLGVALGLLPTTGITLPFVSSGGSSFMACCMMMGIVCSVSRHHVPVLSKDDFRQI